MSFEIFDWKGIRPGDEVEVLDDGLVIARGVIEDLDSDQSLIRLKLSYGKGGRTYRRRLSRAVTGPLFDTGPNETAIYRQTGLKSD